MSNELEGAGTRGTFGGRLAEARANSGLERKGLAQLLSVSEKTIASWENGRSVPRANRMQTLAGVLSVSVGWLMAELGEGPVKRMDRPETGSVQAMALREIAEIREDQRALFNRLGALENLLRERGAAA